jgi:hypothetical protein
VPSPSWPWSFPPQSQRELSFLRARDWIEPAATAFQSVSVPTRVGTYLSMAVPSPSSPWKLYPQAHREPSSLRARQCHPLLAAMACQSVSVPMRVGT